MSAPLKYVTVADLEAVLSLVEDKTAQVYIVEVDEMATDPSPIDVLEIAIRTEYTDVGEPGIYLGI